MRSPAFTGRDGRLRQVDIVTANPMWNQDFPDEMYRNDTDDPVGQQSTTPVARDKPVRA